MAATAGPRASRSRDALGVRVLARRGARPGARPSPRPSRGHRDAAGAGLRRRVAARRRRRARSAHAREPRVVARRHGGVDARARRARRVSRRRRCARRAPHRWRLRRLRRRPRAARDAPRVAADGAAAYRARTGREPIVVVGAAARPARPRLRADRSAEEPAAATRDGTSCAARRSSKPGDVAVDREAVERHLQDAGERRRHERDRDDPQHEHDDADEPRPARRSG